MKCSNRKGSDTPEQPAAEDDRMDTEDWLTVGSAIALAVVVVVWLVAVGGMFV